MVSLVGNIPCFMWGVENRFVINFEEGLKNEFQVMPVVLI